MKIKKSQIICLWLGIIYFFSQQGFYLFPESKIFDILAGCLVVAFVLYIKKYNISFGISDVLMFLPLIMSLIASFVEKYFFSTSDVFRAFVQQAQWWLFAILFFPVSECLKKEIIKIEEIKAMILALGIAQLIIGITQFVFSDYITFVHVSTNIRYDSIRYYYPIVLMVMVLFIVIDELLSNDNKSNMMYMLIVVAVFIEIAIVQKYRSTLVGVMCAVGVLFFLWRKKFRKKIVIGVPVVIIILAIASRGTIIQDTIDSLLHNTDGSLRMRRTLISFLFQNFLESPFWGKGWVSGDKSMYYAASAYRDTYSWDVFAFADGGIFSIMYSYGLIGLIWTGILWGVMLKRGWKIYKKNNKYMYVAFPLYMLITMYIDIHWYIHMQFFSMAIFFAIEEQEYKQINCTVKSNRTQ